MRCEPCDRDYSLINKKASVTGFMFQCSGCRTKASLTTGTFFDNIHVPMHLRYFWASETGCRTQWITLVSSASRHHLEHMDDPCAANMHAKLAFGIPHFTHHSASDFRTVNSTQLNSTCHTGGYKGKEAIKLNIPHLTFRILPGPVSRLPIIVDRWPAYSCQVIHII